jgi:hypothetical protein
MVIELKLYGLKVVGETKHVTDCSERSTMGG